MIQFFPKHRNLDFVMFREVIITQKIHIANKKIHGEFALANTPRIHRLFILLRSVYISLAWQDRRVYAAAPYSRLKPRALRYTMMDLCVITVLQHPYEQCFC